MATNLSGELHGEFFARSIGSVPLDKSPIRQQGIWLTEKDFRENDYLHARLIRSTINPTIKYPCGYHIFHTKKDALNWRGSEHTVCVEVDVRKPVAVGIQGMAKITVAKQIKILSIVV